MSEAIGIRLDNDFLQTVDKMSKEEAVDRSTMLRKLLQLGFSDYLKRKAKEKYVAGKITLSKAAMLANLTVWEMQNYLIEEGVTSNYSLGDLREDMRKLEKL